MISKLTWLNKAFLDFEVTKMKRRHFGVQVIVVLTTLHAWQTGHAQELYSIRLDAPNNRVAYGDPLILRLTLTFAKPRIAPIIKGPAPFVRLDSVVLRARRGDSPANSAVDYQLFDTKFALAGTAGTEYTANVAVWYELRQEGQKLAGRIVFESPGAFELAVIGDNKIPSNMVSVIVVPSALGEKGLALLTGPHDLEFLARGREKDAQTTAHLEGFVKECAGTVLAQMAAARLGIEEYEQLQEKYPNGEEFLVKYSQGTIDEPLVDRIRSHLSEAYRLPNQLPIREPVLSRLAATEFAKGESGKAFQLLDELVAQFPSGEYGSRARATKTAYKLLLDRATR